MFNLSNIKSWKIGAFLGGLIPLLLVILRLAGTKIVSLFRNPDLIVDLENYKTWSIFHDLEKIYFFPLNRLFNNNIASYGLLEMFVYFCGSFLFFSMTAALLAHTIGKLVLKRPIDFIKTEFKEEVKEFKLDPLLLAFCFLFYIFETFILGDIYLAIIIIIPYLMYFIFIKSLINFKNFNLKFFVSTVGLLSLTLVLILYSFRYKNVLAKENAKPLIAAVEKYYLVEKKFPSQLNDLIPEYIEAIPKSKPSIMNNQFNYINIPPLEGEKENPLLLFKGLPPFGNYIYSFQEKEWSYLD